MKTIQLTEQKQIIYDLTFEQWNNQFLSNDNEAENFEFRKHIFDNENDTDNDLTFKEFKQSLKEW